MTDADAPEHQLSSNDRLSLLIGRVCRADVFLEFCIRDLWLGLVGTGPAMDLAPISFEPLWQQCGVMLARALWAPPEGRLLAAGTDALMQAKAAHLDRNRVVHDMWFPDVATVAEGEGPETFVRHRRQRYELGLTVTPQTLDDVASIIATLNRAQNRIVVLRYALPEVRLALGRPIADEQALRMVEGRFDLAANGGMIVHDD